MDRLLAIASRIGADPRDTDELRLRKTILSAFVISFWPLPILWSLIYLAYGEVLAAAIPFAYDVVALASLAVFAATGRFGLFRAVNVLCFILLPLLLQVALGGFAASSAVVMWSVVAPFAALILSGVRSAAAWLGVFGAELVIAAVLDSGLSGSNALPALLVTAFFVLNIGALAAVAVALMATFVSQKDAAMRLLAREQDRSERLLLNVLPREIASRLKAGESPIADAYDAATILFADIVGFTPLTHELEPKEMVQLLNEIFSEFDRAAERHGVEKIRTIGDNWMGVAGVPSPRPGHAAAVARMALDICAGLDRRRARGERQIDFRIGIESGPCVGGVIGLQKFVFDIWGDPVNTASRMESHGVAGRIHVGEAAYKLLEDSFEFEPRGVIEVKGKGAMRTWFLIRERATEGDDHRPLERAGRAGGV
jgi:class 3 adenylate cyclase